MWLSTREYARQKLREAGWTESDAEVAAPYIANHIFWLTFAKGSRSLDQRLSAMETRAAASGPEARSSGPCE